MLRPLCLSLFWGLAGAIDVQKVVREAAATATAAKFASLSTWAADGSIDSRIIWPKPPNATETAQDMSQVFFATNSRSLKYQELLANPHATLVYFDPASMGEVTIKGLASQMDKADAVKEWYPDWAPNYPEGPETPWYVLFSVQAQLLQFVSAADHVDEGSKRTDWRPLTLVRSRDSSWQYSPPPPEPSLSILQ